MPDQVTKNFTLEGTEPPTAEATRTFTRQGAAPPTAEATKLFTRAGAEPSEPKPKAAKKKVSKNAG